MGKRREGREAAVQFLYQHDANATPFDELLPMFWKLLAKPDGKCAVPVKTRAFTEELVRGVAAHRAEIDEKLTAFSKNYQLQRIAVVDRNVLRLGIYEMLHCLDVPPIVVINECLEIAKKYGGEDSVRFVNGILDRVRAELPRDSRTATPRGVRAQPGFPQVEGLKAEGLKAEG